MTHTKQNKDTNWLTVAIITAAVFVVLTAAGAVVHWLTQDETTPPAPGTYPVNISVEPPQPLPTDAGIPTDLVKGDNEKLESNTGWPELDATLNNLYEDYLKRLEEGK